jgi:hypothetical protein
MKNLLVAGIKGRSLRDRSKRDSSTARANNFAGAKFKPNASARFGRNDNAVVAGAMSGVAIAAASGTSIFTRKKFKKSLTVLRENAAA